MTPGTVKLRKSLQQSWRIYAGLSWANPAYHCPAYNGAFSTPTNTTSDDAQSMVGSYAYNVTGVANPTDPSAQLGLGMGTAPDGNGGQLPPQAEAHVAAPSQMFAVMDAQEIIPYPPSKVGLTLFGLHYVGTGLSGWDFVCGAMNGFVYDTQADHNQIVYGPIQHDKDYNVVFCDGHVEAVLRTNLFNMPLSARHWNVDNQPHEALWTEVGF